MVLVILCSAAAQSRKFEVSPPSGRSIRSISNASDLRAEDLETLGPGSDGIRYYFDSVESGRKEGDVSYIKNEMFFMTILPIDYPGLDRFASDLLGADGKPKTVDGLIASMPNLMGYLKSVSKEDLKRRIEPVGNLQRVTLEWAVDEKAVSNRYPNVGRIMTSRLIESFSVNLLNREGDLMLRLEFRENRLFVNFLLDPGGYIVAIGSDGQPTVRTNNKLGLEDVRRGVELFLDVSFDTRVMLLKAFRLFRVEMKRLRILVQIKQNPTGLGIAWRAVEAVPGQISVKGVNTETIRLSLLHMKDTFTGDMKFQPVTGPAGESLTFMRVYGTGERLDNRLVSLALITWEQVGKQAMADFALPISDLLLAVQRDVLERSR